VADPADERARRVGHNEALYRQVNERIEDLNDAFGTLAGDFAVVCECGDLDCTEQIRVPREAYERTRANSTWFLVRPGHEERDIEHVVDREGGYVVVQKDAPEATRVAEETDPRG
jgi:hypothetical protein